MGVGSYSTRWVCGGRVQSRLCEPFLDPNGDVVEYDPAPMIRKNREEIAVLLCEEIAVQYKTQYLQFFGVTY
jgi:hypothetical protein